MGKKIVLRRGDIVWATLGPVKGHEQDGRRPVLILSPEVYNTRTKLAVICPITSHTKGFPFEVAITTKKTIGVVLVDQVRTIDWGMRDLLFIETIDEVTLREVQEKLATLVL